MKCVNRFLTKLFSGYTSSSSILVCQRREMMRQRNTNTVALLLHLSSFSSDRYQIAQVNVTASQLKDRAASHRPIRRSIAAYQVADTDKDASWQRRDLLAMSIDGRAVLTAKKKRIPCEATGAPRCHRLISSWHQPRVQYSTVQHYSIHSTATTRNNRDNTTGSIACASLSGTLSVGRLCCLLLQSYTRVAMEDVLLLQRTSYTKWLGT